MKEVNKVNKVFNELINTIVKNSENNVTEIKNVELWAKSWKAEMNEALKVDNDSKYLHINYVSELIRNMPHSQAIQIIKAEISGQPETTVINGELFVGLYKTN